MPSLLTLLLQLFVIVVAARSAGWLFQRMRQPRVVGEMVVGILLGPSLLGWLAPGITHGLLDAEQLGGLNALSQLGVLLFMFLVGLELQPQQLRHKNTAMLAISLASIALPFVLGLGAAFVLFGQLAEPHIPLIHFALFMGTALSITAFPVLARILAERGLLQTPLGALAIVCAAADDLIAWCLLAGVVFVINAVAANLPIWLMLTGSLLYGALMLTVGRYLAARFLQSASADRLSHAQLAGILSTMIGSAAITEALGIHALFGAFLAGAIMPRDLGLVRQVRAKLEDLTIVLLLPLFFASIGLRANIGLIGDHTLWLASGLIFCVAVVGKLGGATFAARWAGVPWRESLAIGALMNTRGLMELVVASIGLEIGVITPTVFTILVLIAVTTTCMTGPLLDLLHITRPQPGAIERDTELVSEAA